MECENRIFTEFFCPQGKQLNRTELNENSAHLVEGIVTAESGTECRDRADPNGSVVRVLPYDEKFIVYDEKTSGEEDADVATSHIHSGRHRLTKIDWLLIHDSQDAWVKKIDCKVFETDESRAARAKRKEKGEKQFEKASAVAAKSKKTWIRVMVGICALIMNNLLLLLLAPTGPEKCAVLLVRRTHTSHDLDKATWSC